VYTQALAAQSSLVQLLLSLHMDAMTLAAFFRCEHPVAGKHTASRHMSSGVGHVTGVYTHVLFAHESNVQASLSLHNNRISASDLSTELHPDDGLQTGFLQMSVLGHAAPMLVASQAAAVTLHVYVVHNVLAGHGAIGSR
jgi:hypothetical protein